MSSFVRCVALVFVGAVLLVWPGKDAAAGEQNAFTVQSLEIPGGAGGIGFDDLRFCRHLEKLLVPAGGTGRLDLLDPESGRIEAVEGFGSAGAEVRTRHSHDEGTTSADCSNTWLFAIDHDGRKLEVVDPTSRRIVASTALRGDPDYVRWVEPQSEIWVTEPRSEQIEAFRVSAGGSRLTAKAVISVPGGPESLVIDESHNRAYSNLWHDRTVVLSLTEHSIVQYWVNGCRGSRGLALDSRKGLLFVGCSEGGAAVLSTADGSILDTQSGGSGVDIVAYDESLRRLYVPSSRAGTMSVFSVSGAGELRRVAIVQTTAGAHCVAVDGWHQAWVCDPAHGRLLRVRARPVGR